MISILFIISVKVWIGFVEMKKILAEILQKLKCCISKQTMCKGVMVID